MDTRLILFTALLAISWVDVIYGLLLQCPIYQMHFQKVIGFRPPEDLLTKRNILYKDDSSQPFNVINPICRDLCNNDENCISYTLILDKNLCYGLTIYDIPARYHLLEQGLELVADNNSVYFEKACLTVPPNCTEKLWTVTKIPGSTMMVQGQKAISTLVTKRQCVERCLFEKDFHCLSASFAASYRNNQVRFTGQLRGSDVLGRCVLNSKDKAHQPDAFRAASFDEEYIENQCYERPVEGESCSYEFYSNSAFIYAEVKHSGLTQKECQASCSRETKFYCQGVSYFVDREIANSECYLHSEDIISMGPRSLKFQPMSVYMRRVKCLDVSVKCNSDEMVVMYSPKEFFQGKIYANSHSQDCMAIGDGPRPIVLQLPIGNEIQEKRCGIIRAYEVTKQYQRTFISALVVIQNNLNVETQGDRLIKVGCIISNSTIGEPQVQSANVPGSSLAFTQNELPSEGSVLPKGSLAIPKISMQVIDLSHQHETNDVQIGQSLELQIRAQPANTPYDFEATSLVAKANNNTNFIVLIDEKGCPTDVTVFPTLTKLTTSDKKLLFARFHAFKFAGTSRVSFDVKINFCLHRCPPIECHQRSQKRNARDAGVAHVFGESVQIKNPLYVSTVVERVSDVNLTDLEQEDSVPQETTVRNRTPFNLELPLNYDINVRGPNLVDTKGLIYGEKGIVIVAGVDESSSETICINQSLLIALLIFWLIFQVALMFSCCYVIQKYKRLASLDEERRKIQESIDYYEGRRVHWADQGGYTL